MKTISFSRSNQIYYGKVPQNKQSKMTILGIALHWINYLNSPTVDQVLPEHYHLYKRLKPRNHPSNTNKATELMLINMRGISTIQIRTRTGYQIIKEGTHTDWNYPLPSIPLQETILAYNLPTLHSIWRLDYTNIRAISS